MLVDGIKPIQCAARFISEPVIIIHSLKRPSSNDIQHIRGMADSKAVVNYEGDTVTCTSFDDFTNLTDTSSPGALIKAALVALGVVDIDVASASDDFASMLVSQYKHGFEVSCVSALPAGSGLGGSSIIAAAVLQCLSELLQLPYTRESLIHLVLRTEQILGTGGGWQDQVGAIYPGLKIGRSLAGLPLRVEVEQITLSNDALSVLESSMVLIYTGQQRLAKNTLLNALQTYALTPQGTIYDSYLNITKLLTDEANKTAATLKPSLRPVSDTDSDKDLSGLESVTESDDSDMSKVPEISPRALVAYLGRVLNSYWVLKQSMAPGCEPPHITRLMRCLDPFCSGLSLCGAGSGGFLVAICDNSLSPQVINDLVDEYKREELQSYPEHSDIVNQISIHSVSIDMSGIHTRQVENRVDKGLSEYLFK